MAYEFVDESPAYEFVDTPEITGAERLAANPLIRFAMAAGSPVLGAAEWLPGGAGEYFAKSNQTLKEMIKKGESDLPKSAQYLGTAADIGGSVLSPFFLKLAKALPAAKSAGELMKQGALVGGVGGATATTGSADVQDKLLATGIGAGTGAVATPLVVGAARALGNIAAPSLMDSAAERGFAKITSKAAKGEAEDVAGMLAAQQPGSSLETMAQVTAGLRRPELAALQKQALTFDPTSQLRNLEAQEALRKSAVSKLAQDTDPARRLALDEANRLSRAMVSLPQKAEQARAGAAQSVEDVRRLQRATDIATGYAIAGLPTIGSGQRPVIGSGLTQAAGLAQRGEQAVQQAAEQSLRQGATANVAENLVGSWQQRGLRPLTADSIAAKIDSIKTKPENVTNDQLRLILNRVSNSIKRATRPDGTIDADSLYTLRKTGINDTLKRIAGEDKDLAKRLAAGDIQDLKKSIDEAIESAGGKGWKQYLSDYAAARDKIEAPLRKLESMDEIAALGAPEVQRLLGGEFNWTNINLLNPVVSTVNAAMRALEGQAGQNVSRAGARLVLPENTQRLGQLMQQYQANPYGVLGDVTRYQGGAIQQGMPEINTRYRGLLD